MSYQAAAQASLLLLHDFPVAAAQKLGDALRAARTLGAYDAGQEGRSVNFDDQTWQMTPERALAHLQSRVPQSWKKVDGLQDGLLKAQAFWVTGVEQEDALEEILDALNGALANGTPYDEFAKEWSARFEDEGLSQGRLQTVFRTNLFSAYQGGRMAAFQANPGVDLLTYMTAGDDRVRPEHAARAGVTLPKDHPFWADNLPPIDYNCRCYVRMAADGASRTPEGSEALDLPRAANFAAKTAPPARDLLNGYLARKAAGFERLERVSDDDPLLGRFLKTSVPKSAEPQRGTSPAAETSPAPGYVMDPLGRAVALTDPAIEAAGDGSDLLRGTLEDPIELWSTPMRGEGGHTLQATYLQRISPAGYLAVPVRDGVVCGSPHSHAVITPDPQPFRRGVRLI